MESNPIIQSFLAIGIIIAAAQFAGAAARALGQPRVFGELLAGVLLGPSLLNMTHWGVFDDPEHLHLAIKELAELGVLLLMFAVGLEVHLRELAAVGRVALLGGALGAVLPVVFVAPIVMLFDYSAEAAVFAGVTMAATSVSISAQTLLELGVLRTKVGFGLLATAVVDDVLAILLLSITVAVFGSEGSASVGKLAWIFARMTLYIGGALILAWTVLPRALTWIHQHRQLSSSVVAFSLFAALLFGWAAEELGGIAAITGAFIAGIGIGQASERTKNDIIEAVQSLSYSFFVPIFFISVGLETDLSKLGSDMLPLALLLVIAAVGSKVIGSGFGAKLGGFSESDSFRLGVCMISRGEVGLIIATLGLTTGLLNEELFQPVFLVILLTTVITPPLVRLVFRGQTSNGFSIDSSH